MTIDATFTINNASGVAQSTADLVQSLVQAALNTWAQALAGYTNINVRVSIVDQTSSGRAQGGNETGIFATTRNGYNIFEPGTAYELRTGLQHNQSGADIHIQIARDYLLNELFLDTTLATSNDIPSNRTDAYSVFLHEIGHALGFIGYYNEATDTFASSANTPYDTRLITNGGGDVRFDGPNVRAVYGNSVPLTDMNYAHYGNTNAFPGTSTDPLTGLMNGVVYYRGYRYGISSLDLAFMADMGIGTVNNDVFDISYFHAFTGGRGNDTYHVYAQSDVAREFANEGTDTVIAHSNYYLWSNIENLTLASGAGNIFGVGNELANTITGNEGDNTLLAGLGDDIVHGGAGVDIIYGEDGADQLFGDANNDVLIGGNGDDVMDGGAGGDSLYGEAGNDTLYGGTTFEFDRLVGGDGNDILHGDSGQADYDYLYGNAGDDSFYVDTGDDLTFEQAGEGTDTVYANVAGANNGVYLYANIENLVLLGTTTFGVGNELANTMTGNASGNYLLGGAGNDILNGKAGGDVLFGEAGADTFVFEHGTGGDVIGDFVPGTDRIDLTAIGYTWQQVQNSLHENGGSTAIDLGNGDLVVLNGVTIAQLHQADFILSGGGSSGSAPLTDIHTTKADVMMGDPAILPAVEPHAHLFHDWFGYDRMPLTMPLV